MDSLIFKSFLPEIFFSTATLMLIVLNTRTINNLKYNFPVIDKEVFSQIVFVLILFFIFQNSLKIQGIFSTFTLGNNYSICFSKQVFVIFTILALILINESYTLQKLSFIEFYFIFALSLLSFFLMISCSDLLMFYVLMELQALSFYVLASFNRNSIFSLEAGLKYFVFGAFASGVYLLGVSFLYGALGTIHLHDLFILFKFRFFSYNPTMDFIIDLSVLLITCSLLFKVTAAPFYDWVMDVYEGAPLSSTILFSIVPKIPLFIFLSKWISVILNRTIFFESMPFLGFITIVVGTLGALGQKKLKRLIIYSSIGQTGFIIFAVCIPYYAKILPGSMFGFFFLLIYLIASILLWSHFVLLHSFAYKTNTYYSARYTSLYISTMIDFFKSQPLWAFSLIVIFFSMAGIPPLAGFNAKLAILQLAIESESYLFSISLVLISSVSVYYYLKILKVLLFEPKLNSDNEDFRTVYSVNSLLTLIPILVSILLFLHFYPRGFFMASYVLSQTGYSF